MRALIATVLVGISLLATLASGQQAIVPAKAPAFDLRGLNGERVNFADYRGKVILLDFWATWCVPCRTEVPKFVALQNRYSRHGFQMLGISMDDSPEPVRRFRARFKMNYPLAMGTPAVAESYGGVLGLPLAFLIARDGRIVKVYDGSANLDLIEQDIQALLDEKKP